MTIRDGRNLKKDRENHGFGLLNVKTVLFQYPDSVYGMEYQNREDSFTLEMPNPSNES